MMINELTDDGIDDFLSQFESPSDNFTTDIDPILMQLAIQDIHLQNFPWQK